MTDYNTSFISLSQSVLTQISTQNVGEHIPHSKWEQVDKIVKYAKH